MTQYRRRPEAVRAALVKNAAGQILTRQDLTVYFPVRFAERELATLGVEVKVIGVLCMALASGEYSVWNGLGRFVFRPERITKTMFDDVEYYQLSFPANSVVLPSMEIMRDNTVIYPVLDEFWFRGKVPWYLEYDDMLRMFGTAKVMAASDTGDVMETLEAITSIIARNPAKRTELYRHTLGGKRYGSSKDLSWVPLASVQYSVTSPLGKLAGGYFNDGVVSALTTPTDTVSSVERVLR